MACKLSGIPKSRVDVWQPKMKEADGSSLMPARWVTLETPTNLLTNQDRGNALISLALEDNIEQPRKATLRISNKSNDYRTVYDGTDSDSRAATTYTHTYNDSDGNDAAGGARTLAKSWGLYTNFFYEFQFVRVVDMETNLVLFSGRIYGINKKYEDGLGSVVVLECKDALEELHAFSCRNLAKGADFLASRRRSDFIKFGLNLVFDYYGTNVKPAGGPEKSQPNPSISTLGSAYNITNADIAESDAANSYSRFERSETTVGHVTKWRLAESGNRSMLAEILHFAAEEPHEDSTADDRYGYDFFVDSNIGSANLSATTAPPAAHFNYVKRGNRLSKVASSTQSPADHGLTIHFPTGRSEIAQGHKTDGDPSVTQVAKKIMHRAFDFESTNEKWTHGLLTYNAREDGEDPVTYETYSMKIERVKTFEIIWVNYLNGQFLYAGKNIDDEWKTAENSTPGTDSGELLDAYNAAGNVLKASAVARVQHQSNPGNSTATADFYHVMLSDISDIVGGGTFPIGNYDDDQGNSEDYVTLKGATSGFQCRFNAATTGIEAQEGRPWKVWGVKKEFHEVREHITHPDDLRKIMSAKLGQGSMEMKRGTYQVSKAPYYWYDAKVLTASNVSSPAGQRLTLKNINGNSAINLTPFGFREGMLVHKMDDTFSGMEQSSNNDVYGYCFNMESNYQIDVDLTENETFEFDDNIRLFIPIRASDIIRVDNAIADVFGDHIITKVTFEEFMGPITQIDSIGANEGRKAGGIAKRTLFSAIDKSAIEERINVNIGNSIGNQRSYFSGTITYPAANQVSWTLGNLTTANNVTYQIVAGSTSDASPHGLGGSGMTGTNKYVTYVDPDGENPASNAYHIKTVLLANYVQDADNIRLNTVEVGTSLPSVHGEQLKADGSGTPTKVDATTIIHPESMTSGLLKKGAQYWSTDLKFEGTDFNIVRWGQKDNIANNATVSFGDDDTEAITKHTGYTFDTTTTGTYWVYKTVGSSPSATLVVTQTYSDVSRADTDRILLATVIVATDVGQGSPTILPFNGNTPTMSVGAFAAGSIVAGDIKTNTITTTQLNFAPGTFDNGDALTAGTIGSWSINANQIYSGSVHTGDGFTSGAGVVTFNSNGSIHTPKFFVDVDGDAGFSGALSGASGTFTGALNGGTISIGSSDDIFKATSDGIHLGHASFASAPFKVAMDGTLTASSGTFGGTISALTMESGTVSLGGGEGIAFTSSSTGDTTSNNSSSIRWTYNNKHTWLFRKNSSNVMQFITNATTAADGKIMFTNMNLDVDGTGHYFHGGDSLADLYGGGETDLHSHAGSTPDPIILGVGSNAAPTYTFTNHTNSGMRYQTGGDYEGVALVGHGRHIIGAWSDGINDYVDMGGHLDMNGYDIVELDDLVMNGSGSVLNMNGGTITALDEVQAASGSTSDPSYTFDGNTNYGMYLASSGLQFTVGNSLELSIYQGYGQIYGNFFGVGYNLGSSGNRWGRLYASYLTDVSSDAELKENLTPISNGLDFISRLTPITFNRVDSSEIEFGFTAQAMKQTVLDSGYTENLGVYSETLDEETGETNWGISYEMLVAPLVASIKELKARIEILEGN